VSLPAEELVTLPICPNHDCPGTMWMIAPSQPLLRPESYSVPPGDPVGAGGGGVGDVEAGVGPPGLVHHLPVDEHLVISLPQVPALPGLVDRAAVLRPAVDQVGAADGDLLAAVGLEGNGRRAAAVAHGADGFAVGAAADEHGVARRGEVGGALDRAERVVERAGVAVGAVGGDVVRRQQDARLEASKED
jgi:hypothetical protein